jgi:hypothetical protein
MPLSVHLTHHCSPPPPPTPHHHTQAQCTKSTQLPLALNLVAEMRARGVAINNHTYRWVGEGG